MLKQLLTGGSILALMLAGGLSAQAEPKESMLQAQVQTAPYDPQTPSGTTTTPTETTPPAEGTTEITPPAEGTTEITPPAEGTTEITPPAEGTTEITPPAEGTTETTPPTEGTTEITPPAEGTTTSGASSIDPEFCESNLPSPTGGGTSQRIQAGCDRP